MISNDMTVRESALDNLGLLERAAPGNDAGPVMPAQRLRPMDNMAARSEKRSAYHIELCSPATAAGATAEWQDLAGRALEANIFYEPAALLLAIQNLEPAASVQFLMVWSADGGDTRRLVACWPFFRSRGDLGAPLWRGWLHPHAASGAPLVDAGEAADVIAAILAFVARAAGAPVGLVLPKLPIEGAFNRVLTAVLAASALVSTPLAPYNRAIIRFDAGTTDKNGPNAKKLKELRRQKRRLAERGVLTSTVASVPREAGAAAEQFLALEANGWKGRRGTALSLDPGTAAFVRALSASLAGTGQIATHTLAVDDKPVAIGIVLKTGQQAYFWKIAFDEAFAAYSPGVLLTLELTEAMRADESIAMLDSCAISDHPMIDHLWRDRLAVSDMLVPLTPKRAFRHALARRREAAKRDLRALAKTLFYRITGRKRS